MKKEVGKEPATWLADGQVGNYLWPFCIEKAKANIYFLGPMHLFTWRTQAQSLIRDELIGREAVVELNHLHVLRANATLAVNSICRFLGHVIADLKEETDCARKHITVEPHLSGQRCP